MRLPHNQQHLTYCLNVHPGETWAEQLESIRTHAVEVREKIAPEQPFGLGLRLSDTSSEELTAHPALVTELQEFLHRQHMYVFTVNAFPFGKFHGGPVKENVYAPDWRTLERVKYTVRVAELLAKLIPTDGTAGSISTVPGSYKDWIQNEDDRGAITKNLAFMAAHLKRLEDRTGRYIHLGLEPEPCCLWETTPEFLEFFQGELLSWGAAYLHDHFGFEFKEVDAIIRRYIGICFDCCHMAIQYEDLAASLDRLKREGVLISKVHISAALRGTPGSEERLAAFQDDVYLHQVKAKVRNERQLLSWHDLPTALPGLGLVPNLQEYRCHFHVPLYWGGEPGLGTTRDDLTSRFWDRIRSGACQHLEVETYTFGVMPPDLRPERLSDAIAEELKYALAKAGGMQSVVMPKKTMKRM
jgi:sugar phosphate isomerase/epimerase